LLSTIAALMALPRPSTIKMKRKGDRGSPCLMPREGEKVVEGDPLTNIEKKAVEVRVSTHLIQRGEKPKSLRYGRYICKSICQNILTCRA
jgi:hypothetical protein